jgi:hypothetical protein
MTALRGLTKKIKNQSHVVADNAAHLASSASPSPVTATTAITCYRIHAGKPLELHCATRDKTICMECGSFEHDGHEKVRIADVTAESREIILHRVECSTATTKQLSAAKVQLQACCRGNSIRRLQQEGSRRVAKRVRQATTAAVNAANVKVDDLMSRKIGAGDAFI